MKHISFIPCALLCSTLFLVGETPKPAPKPPVLSDSDRASFWKAQSQFQEASESAKVANQKAQQAQAALESAIESLKAKCGKDFTPTMENGDVACAAKPEPAKTEKK